MRSRTTTRVLVTGGGGFIGSHLVDALMARGDSVHVLDNLATGSKENVKRWFGKTPFTFMEGDLLNPSDLAEIEAYKYEAVFHLAADPEVRVGQADPSIHFRQNVVATQNLLEHLRKTQDNLTLLFASTSTVYGEPAKTPTPENYTPLAPISIYGATKLACEALIAAYAQTCGFKAVICRLANIVGPRSKHGVIHDFVQKLRRNPKQLEILGDGNQTKSYLYISDCIEAMLLTTEGSTRERIETYNIGSEDQINVKAIAQIVIEEMGLNKVELVFTGGVDGGRGWKGDVKNMLLDTAELKSKGWKPRFNSAEAVRKTAKQYSL